MVGELRDEIAELVRRDERVKAIQAELVGCVDD